jgi:hypothetical protein
LGEDENKSTIMPIIINAPKPKGGRKSKEDKNILINKDYELSAPLKIDK